MSEMMAEHYRRELEAAEARVSAMEVLLDAMVESAFREGWLDGHAAHAAASALEPAWTEDAAWAESDARAALEGKSDE